MATALCGKIQLTPPARPHHFFTSIFGNALTIVLAIAMNQLLPFYLSTFLGMPRSEQGSTTGLLASFVEAVQLPLVFVFGALSDKFSRRTVWVGGVLVLGLSYFSLSWVRNLGALYASRGILAVGMAGCVGMPPIVTADIIQDCDRGKAQGISGVVVALGAGLSAVFLGQMPAYYGAAESSSVSCEEIELEGDKDAMQAGVYSALTLAVVCVCSAAVLWCGLGGHKTQPATNTNMSMREPRS